MREFIYNSMYSTRFHFSFQLYHALAFLSFVLPWQARFTLRQITWSDGVWEYGTLGIYATEIVLWGAAVWFVISRVQAAHAARASDEQDVVFTRMRAALFAYKKICWCAGIFLAWFMYHIWRAQFPWVQVQALVHIFEASVLFYFIYSARAHARFLEGSFLAGLGAQALLALVQFFTQDTFASRWLGMTGHPAWAGGSAVIETVGGRWVRAYGGLPHPNILGGYMAIGALLIAARVLESPREKNTRYALRIAFLLAFFILFMSGLTVSFSRSAMLALVSGLMILSWQYVRKIRRQTRNEREVSRATFWQGNQTIARRIGITWLSGFLAVAIFFALAPDVFITRTRGQTRLEQQSIFERIESYKHAREVLRREWFWGTGLGNYTGELYALNSSRPGWAYQPVHNAFVLMFLELGFVMSIAVLWFLFSFLCARIFVSDWGLLVPLVILAMFDHYLWSLFGGMILSAMVFARVTKAHLATVPLH